MRIWRIKALEFAGCAWLLLFLLAAPSSLRTVHAQQNQSNDPTQRFAIQQISLPKGFVRQAYRFQLSSQGGTTPIHWQLTSGALPKGLSVSDDGVVSGSPEEVGRFTFQISASDSEKPNAHQDTQEFVVQVVSSLFAQWSQYPAANGKKIAGSIKVSNQTETDFDLTMIVLAVNEIGRATTLGYQHFTLNKDTIEMEIPFGETLPNGSYFINADVVAEVPSTNTIHRARLVSNERIQIKQPL